MQEKYISAEEEENEIERCKLIKEFLEKHKNILLKDKDNFFVIPNFIISGMIGLIDNKIKEI